MDYGRVPGSGRRAICVITAHNRGGLTVSNEEKAKAHARLEDELRRLCWTWMGGNALRLTYRTESGRLDERILYRDHEPRLQTVRKAARALDADAKTFKLAAEALRIRMAGRFDPMLAVQTSDLEPLPRQIQAVYGELLNKTPLRFLLAEDPGAGKTIRQLPAGPVPRSR